MASTPNIRLRKLIPAATATACIVLAGLLLTAGIADGRSAKRLGQTDRTPDPLCPKPCRATGTVTGFGVVANGERGLYKAPSDGHIVAWSVSLAEPEPDQVSFFEDAFEDEKFGGEAYARLGLLKRKNNTRYKLTKQSPAIALTSNFGEDPIYTLDNPLRAKKGTIVALTLPTWAPLFKDELPEKENVWVTSRKPDSCGVEGVLEAKPHQRKGTTRTYGCRLSGERILYTAYFVPDKKKK